MLSPMFWLIVGIGGLAAGIMGAAPLFITGLLVHNAAEVSRATVAASRAAGEARANRDHEKWRGGWKPSAP